MLSFLNTQTELLLSIASALCGKTKDERVTRHTPALPTTRASFAQRLPSGRPGRACLHHLLGLLCALHCGVPMELRATTRAREPTVCRSCPIHANRQSAVTWRGFGTRLILKIWQQNRAEQSRHMRAAVAFNLAHLYIMTRRKITCEVIDGACCCHPTQSLIASRSITTPPLHDMCAGANIRRSVRLLLKRAVAT